MKSGLSRRPAPLAIETLRSSRARPSPRARASMNSCSNRLAIFIGTSNSRPKLVASPTSLRARRKAKRTVSKSPLNMRCGRVWFRVSPWPIAPSAMARRSASGSTPAFTPTVSPSARRARNPLLDHIVDNLGNQTTANPADVGNLVANRLEDRFDPLIDGLVTADHDRQRGGLGSDRSATDRGIKDMDVLLLVGGVNLSNECRRAGREIDIRRSWGTTRAGFLLHLKRPLQPQSGLAAR